MSEAPLAFLGELRPAFVAHLAARLCDQICRQTAQEAERLDIVAPEHTHSAMLYLAKRGPATLAEMARSDDQPHQLLAARLAPLERLGLIERSADPADGRRRPYRLTAKGRAEIARIEKLAAASAAAMRELFEEMGVDLIAVLEEAMQRLQRRPLTERATAAPPAKKRSLRRA